MKVNFQGFWDGFEPLNDNLFKKILKRFKLEITNNHKESDIIIFSVNKKFNNTILKNKIRILYSAENDNRISSKEEYDLSIKMNISDNYKDIWLPNYIRRYGFDIQNKLINPNLSIDKIKKRDFCSFFSSTPCKKRDDFFKELSSYKMVNSFGRHLNNTNMNNKKSIFNESKIHTLEKHNFNLCFENSYARGYITEKLIDSFIANTIPIYWGCDMYKELFDEKSVIYAPNFKNNKNMIDFILSMTETEILDMINRNKIKNEISESIFFKELDEKITTLIS